MLMSAASVTLKDQVKLFDEGITKPFITAMYHWNMQFSPKPELKGDFKVRARGWTGLVARELYVGQLDSFAKSTANGLDSPWINRGELLRRRAEARDLGPGIVKTDEELRGDLARAGLARARPAGPAQEEDGNG
jgi:hypothetical protein